MQRDISLGELLRLHGIRRCEVQSAGWVRANCVLPGVPVNLSEQLIDRLWAAVIAAIFNKPSQRSLLIEGVDALCHVIVDIRADELLHLQSSKDIVDVQQKLVALFVGHFGERVVWVVAHEHGVDACVGVSTITILRVH